MAVDISQYVLVSRQTQTKPRVGHEQGGTALISYNAHSPSWLHLNPAACRVVHFNDICEVMTARDLTERGYFTLENRPFIFRDSRKVCACLISKHKMRDNNFLITTMPLSAVAEEEKGKVFIMLSDKRDFGADVHCTNIVKPEDGTYRMAAPAKVIVRNQGTTCVLVKDFVGRKPRSSHKISTLMEEPMYEDLPPPQS